MIHDDPRDLIAALRIFSRSFKGRGQFTLREHVYPEIARLFRSKRHSCRNIKAAQAEVRCTLQRHLRDQEGLVFKGRGRYEWPAPMIAEPAFDFTNFNFNHKDWHMAGITVASRTMKLEEFLALPAYKGQRDTERHAARLLSDPDFDPENPTLGHTIVLASYMGKVYVMDGNTQRLLHTQGHIALPSVLPNMKLYYCNSLAQLDTVYNSYNAAMTAKTASDQTFSAFKLCNIKPQSKFFSKGSGKSALDFAEGARRGLERATTKKDCSALDLAKQWKDEVAIVDAHLASCRPGKIGTNAGLIAGQMLTYRKDPEKAAKFWELFYSSLGKVGDAGAPWNRLFHRVGEVAGKKGGARAATMQVVGNVLYAFEHCADNVENSLDLPTRFTYLRPHEYIAVTTKAPKAAKVAAKASRAPKHSARAAA